MNRTISISPAYSEVVLNSGDSSKQISVVLTNNTTVSQTFELSTVDFKQQGTDGRISFLTEQNSGYSYSLASFVSLETNTLELEPGEKKNITVTVSNREDLSPGGHYAAVLAKAVYTDKANAPAVMPTIASLILVRRTGGERYNLHLVDQGFNPRVITFGYPDRFYLLMQNEGNVHLIPYGEVSIKDQFQRVIYKGSINEASYTVFPESRRYILVELTKINASYPVSFNTLLIKGRDSLNKTVFGSQDVFVYISPWLILLTILLVIALIFFKKLRKKP